MSEMTESTERLIDPSRIPSFITDKIAELLVEALDVAERVHSLTYVVSQVDGALSLLSNDETIGVPSGPSLPAHVAHNELFDALMKETGFSSLRDVTDHMAQALAGEHTERFCLFRGRLGL